MNKQVYIALLRGINVGGKVLKMADLKQAIQPLGFEDVCTYLQSGNVLFRAPPADNETIADRITQAIRATSALDVHVIVRTESEWSSVIASNPFPAAAETPKWLHAFVLDRLPDEEKIMALASRDFGTEQWKIVGDTLYLHTPDGFGTSKLGNLIERALKVPMTARNWNTVVALEKLAATL